MNISTRLTLGKDERLKSRKIIESLFKDGRSIAVFPVRITWKLLEEVVTENKDNNPRLQAGFSASSRNFKKAVDRNRIKRLLRETYRKQKPELEEFLVSGNNRIAIFIIFTGKELPVYVVVEEKMKAALKKLMEQLKGVVK